MSAFLMVPINANGVVMDADIAGNAANAMSAALNISDVFVYSHGWSTDADGAMTLYNRFSIEFMHWLADNPAGPALTHSALSVGIHWPSELTEDSGSVPPAFAAVLDKVQPLTFYTMEKRADSTGTHGVYAVLRQLISNYSRPPVLPPASAAPLTINLIGHSFGCKVVTSALEAIYADLKTGKLQSPLQGLRFRLVLIQGAFENKQLDPKACYGDVAALDIQMLVTTSQLDSALVSAFPLAHRLVDFFGDPAPALGAAGPTAATIAAFGGADQLSIVPAFDTTLASAATERLVVADLTPLHAAHPENDNQWGGHHSDFNHPEVYALIAGFLRRNMTVLTPPSP